MPKINVVDMAGKVVSELELNENVFGIEPNKTAMHSAVVNYLANQRQGTHDSKERSEVAYSTKKIIRQKGSGGARHGSIKSNIYVGGGRAFGPHPRYYGFKLNRKLKQLARFSALAYKAQENAITVVEQFKMEEPKTKQFLSILNNIKANGRRVLFVLPENSENIYLSARNLENVQVATADVVNTYDVMRAYNLVLVEGAEVVLQAGRE